MNHNDIKCLHCGRPLPEGTSFCPYCEKEQNNPSMIIPPVRSRKAVLAAVVMTAVLVAFIAVIVHGSLNKPAVYEGSGALIQYPFNGKTISVLLSFSVSSGETGTPTESKSVSQMSGQTAAIPSQLFIFQEGLDERSYADLKKQFKEQISDYSVVTVPVDGSVNMEVALLSEGSEDGRDKIFQADIVYDTDCQTNLICWTLNMKNGDVIKLQHSMTCEELPTLEYSYEDTKLDTSEDIMNLIREVRSSENKDAILILYLPPVTYTDPLVLDEGTAMLLGYLGEEESKRTVFADTITICTRQPQLTEIQNVDFTGSSREGTGILAYEGARVQGCNFSGLEVGVDSQNGSWVMMENNSFTDNRIGFRFDSNTSTCSNEIYYGLTFRDNETGMQILSIPADTQISVNQSVFENNGTDIEDPQGLVIMDD